MIRNYNLSHRLLASILLLILFLQSCGGPFNQLIPQKEEIIEPITVTSKETDIQTLLGKEFIVSGGNLITFYEQDGGIRADIRVDDKQPMPNYEGLTVITEKGTNLAELTKLDPTTQQQRIQLKAPKSGQPGYIKIFGGGIRGGMLEGDNYQENEKETEKEPKDELSNYQQLLELAIQGDAEAQFRLGKRAHEAWQEQRREEPNHEARVWLGKAAIQSHQGAIALLKEMNSNLLPKEEVKEERRELEKLVYNQKDEIEKTQLIAIQEQEKIELPSSAFQTLWQISQTTGEETYRDEALQLLVQEIKIKEDLALICRYFKKLANLGTTVDKLIIQASKALPVASKDQDLLSTKVYVELDRLYKQALVQIKNIAGNSGEREFAKLKLTYHYYRLLEVNTSMKKELFSEMENILDDLDSITNLNQHLRANISYMRYLLLEADQLDLTKGEDIKKYIQEVEDIADNTAHKAIDYPDQAKELRKLAGKLYCEAGKRSKQLLAGSGREKSENNQLSYYGRAVKLGNKVAFYQLADLYEYPLLMEKNLRKAKDYYVEAAGKGYALAEYKLALLYESEGKQKLAFERYKRAAIKGHPEALYKLYQASIEEVAKVDQHETLVYLQQAASLGHKEAQYELGKAYWEKGKYSQAVHWYEQAAYKGIQASYAYLGLAARKGLGQAKNSQLALDFYLRAEKGGEDNPIARYGRARLYEKGEGVDLSLQTAVNLYTEASELGYSKGAYRAGRLHLQGQLPMSDMKKGYEFLELAGRAGIPKACLLLATIHEHGLGREPDTKLACDWYMRASLAKGKNKYIEASASYHAGWIHKLGTGIERNEAEALSLLKRASILGKDVYAQTKELLQSENTFLLHRAAEQGDADAQYNLAKMYERGNGVVINYQEAVKWYQKAADQGHEIARARLARCYYNGWGIKKNMLQATKLLEQAHFLTIQRGAQVGKVDYQFILGWMYDYGQGVEQNYKKAIKWYRRAAKKGDAVAQNNLGRMYANDEVISKDYKKVLALLQQAADQGYAIVQYNLSSMYYNGQGVPQDYQKAVKWYQKSAEQGYAAAQFNLGWMHSNGQGVTRDYKKALEWFEKAAEQNYVAAQYNLGLMYENGCGVTQNHQEAIKWYIKAANQGHFEFSGRDASKVVQELALKDIKSAQEWIIEQGEKGNKEAQYTLGQMYEQEKGVQKDEEKAAEWYIKAVNQDHRYAPSALRSLALKGIKLAQECIIGQAEKGDKEAQYSFGQMYEQGKGVEKEEEKAAEWYIKAASQGNSSACWALRNLALKEIKIAQEWIVEQGEKGDKEAQYTLGQMYEQGKRVERNEERAAKWYIKAAKQNYSYALSNLRSLALKGIKLAQDWVIEQGEKGDKEAQYTLGQMYEQGKGVERNEERAAEWYIKAAKQNYSYPLSNLRSLALKGIKLAQNWVIEQGEKGDKETQYTFGQMYEQGKGVEKNEEKAAEWYIKAANRGHFSLYRRDHPSKIVQQLALKGIKLAQDWVIEQAEKGHEEAQYSFGQMYEQGKGVERDEEKAAEWYIKAAKQDNSNACTSLRSLALKDIKPAQEWVIEQGEKGNKEAQYSFGEMYEQGKGVEKDEEKAAEWYIKVANQGNWVTSGALRSLALKGIKLAQNWVIEQAEKGHEEAQYSFGQMYEQGKGVERDEEKAAEWYIKAAKQDNSNACTSLRSLALKGIKLVQDWVIEQGEKGDKDAQYTLGQMYKKGKGVEKDEEKAAEWYIKAANQDHSYAPNALHDLALRRIKLACDWVVEQAERGDREAQYSFGQMYEQGKGIEKDEEKAAEWYIKAAKQGNSNACRSLRNLALKDIKLAQDWVIEQGEKGDKDAQYTLGQMYEQGKGVEKDEEKAAEWYIKAANQDHSYAPNALRSLALKDIKPAQEWVIEQGKKGDEEAQYTLGQMYEQEKGVEKDEEKAAGWYIKAAKQDHSYASNALCSLALKDIKLAQEWVIVQVAKGDKEAQYTLGQMYEQGKGVERDEEKAAEWYIKAVNQRHRSASKALRCLASKGIKLAQDWKK